MSKYLAALLLAAGVALYLFMPDVDTWQRDTLVFIMLTWGVAIVIVDYRRVLAVITLIILYIL